MWNNSSSVAPTTGQDQSEFPVGMWDSGMAGKSAVMIISIAIALTGNFFILFTFVRNFKMRTTTNLLVVNLCFSDFLSALVEAPFWFSTLTEQQLIQQRPLLCRILLSFEDLFQIAALLNMCAISFDRFMALVRGSRRKISRKRAHQILAWCWAQSFVFTLPWGLLNNKEPDRCLYFPLFYEPGIDVRIVNVLFKVACIILPLAVVYYIFYRILKAARGNRKVSSESTYISRNSSAERFAVDAHRRSSKTAIILFLMFALCTLPYLGIIIWAMAEHHKHAHFSTGFAIYFVFSLKRSLFPAIYIFRNRVIVSYLTETMKCSVCKQQPKSSLAGSAFSYVPTSQNSPALDPGPCFVVFGRRSHRSRIHPSVYDGDHHYFPKNLDVYFCTLKELSKSNQFSDISADDPMQEHQQIDDATPLG